MVTNKRWIGTLGILREKHKAGVTIWWRRKYFSDPAFRDREPKWHVFKDRLPIKDEKYKFGWVALCGYTHAFDEFMFEEFPQIKSSGNPIRSAQCIRCRKELEKGNAQHKESNEAKRSDLPEEKGGTVSPD